MLSLRPRATRWLAVPAAVYALLLADWRGASEPRRPVVRRAFSVSGPLLGGAARVRLAPPLPVVRAGYAPPRVEADHEHDPLEMRAVIVRASNRTLALVLADLVLVPEELLRSLESRVADLRLDGLLLAATHTHSSVGGFHPLLFAQVAGTGRYRPDVVACLVDRAEQVVREAARRLAPIHIRTASARLEGWARNRSSPGTEVDSMLTVAELAGEGEQRLATLAVVAGHPTLFARTDTGLSAEYPGNAMRRLEEAGGIVLLMQGAEGDARPPGDGEAAVEAAGGFVAERVEEALGRARPAADRLGFAEAELGLPPVEPLGLRWFLLRRPAANLLAPMLPHTARVTVVTLGDLRLLSLPGEPTARAARQIIGGAPGAEPANGKTRVVALAQGYIGYIDTREQALEGLGEARRAWFAPDLLEALKRGLEVAAAAAAVREAE